MRDFKNQNHPPDRAIKAKTVLLINSEGQNLGITDTREAYRIAEAENLDLVQVGDGKNDVPVCKIMDLGKWKYEQTKKQKTTKAAQHTTKEFKIRPNTSEYDLKYRANQAGEFLASGDKVKVLVRFKGRERNHMTETGRAALEKFLSMLDSSKYRIEKAVDVSDKEISILLFPPK